MGLVTKAGGGGVHTVVVRVVTCGMLGGVSNKKSGEGGRTVTLSSPSYHLPIIVVAVIIIVGDGGGGGGGGALSMVVGGLVVVYRHTMFVYSVCFPQAPREAVAVCFTHVPWA